MSSFPDGFQLLGLVLLGSPQSQSFDIQNYCTQDSLKSAVNDLAHYVLQYLGRREKDGDGPLICFFYNLPFVSIIEEV